MFQIIYKIWYLVVILPILIVIEGYKMLKKFMAKRGYTPDWAWAWLVILVVLLLIALLFQVGYH